MNTAVRIEQLEAERDALKASNAALLVLLEGACGEIQRLESRAFGRVDAPSVAPVAACLPQSTSVADVPEGAHTITCAALKLNGTGVCERPYDHDGLHAWTEINKAAAIQPSGEGATGAATSDAGPVHGSPPLVPSEPQS